MLLHSGGPRAGISWRRTATTRVEYGGRRIEAVLCYTVALLAWLAASACCRIPAQMEAGAAGSLGLSAAFGKQRPRFENPLRLLAALPLSPSRQFLDPTALGQNLAADIHQVPVVGKQDYLGFFREASQLFHHSPGAGVVEVQQDVVGDERQTLALLQVMMEAGQAKRQVESHACRRA